MSPVLAALVMHCRRHTHRGCFFALLYNVISLPSLMLLNPVESVEEQLESFRIGSTSARLAKNGRPGSALRGVISRRILQSAPPRWQREHS
eukprot:SAG11_NODE_27013_length_338_cov_0.832636_1_plen_90_part_10